MNIEELNNASFEVLADIEGLGKKKAKEIIDYRNKNGRFKTFQDLKKVPGFDDEMINLIRGECEDFPQGE